MGSVRIRRAQAGDVLVVAALRLQAARAGGAAPEPGFLDRFAAAWDPEEHPTWVAALDGSHAGVLIAQVVRDLPWPGLAPGLSLRVSTCFAGEGGAAVEQALTEAMTGWARSRGLAVPA